MGQTSSAAVDDKTEETVPAAVPHKKQLSIEEQLLAISEKEQRAARLREYREWNPRVPPMMR
jgi:hypothetical protein